MVSPLTGPGLPLLQRSLQCEALPPHPGAGPSEKRASFSFAERCVCVTHRSQDNFNSEAGPKNATGFLFSLAGSAGSGAPQKPPPTQVGWLNGGLVRGPAGRELVSGRPTTSPARRAQLEAPASAASSSQSATAAMAGAPTLALLLLGQLLATTVTLTEAQVSMGPGAYGARL